MRISDAYIFARHFEVTRNGRRQSFVRKFVDALLNR